MPRDAREPGAGRAHAVAVLTACAVAAVLAGFWLHAREASIAPTPSTTTAPRTAVAPSLQQPAAPPAAERRRAPRLPAFARTRARQVLDRYIADAGLEDRVGEADRRELMTALARFRRANLARHGLPDRATLLRQRHEQTLAESDAVFRRLLGVGIRDFVAATGSSSQVEDLGARP